MDAPRNHSVINVHDGLLSDLPVSTQPVDTTDKVSQIASNLVSGPSSTTAPASALEKKTVSIAKCAFQLNALFSTEKPLVHEMTNLSFDSEFFKTLVLHLNDFFNPAPIPRTENDYSCLEYMFFKSLTFENLKSNNLIRARQIVALIEQHRPHDPSARLMMAYLACADFTELDPIYSYAEVNDFLTKAQVVNPNSIELLLLKIWAAKKEGEISTLIGANLMLNKRDPSYDPSKLFAQYLHDPTVLQTMICLCSKANIDETEYVLQLLLLDDKNSLEALDIANALLKKRPTLAARHCKIRALLKLKRIEECESFVRTEKLHKDVLIQALIHSAKKQDTQAYPCFIKFFEKTPHAPYWIILELCNVLERVGPTRVDAIIMSTLARAVEIDRSNIPVARQAFIRSLHVNLGLEAEFPLARLPTPKQLWSHVKSLDPQQANRYDLMYATYKLHKKDHQACFEIADSLFKNVVSDPTVEREIIVEVAVLLSRLGRKDSELALLKEHYEATFDEDYLQRYVNCLQFLKVPQRAVEVLEKHVERFPYSMRANQLHACLLETTGNYAAAMVAINKVLSLDPKNEYALILRSDFYFRQKEYQKCIEDYLQCADSADPAIALVSTRNLSKVFKSYLELNRLGPAKKLLKHPNSDFAIGEDLRLEYAEKVKAKKEKAEKPTFAREEREEHVVQKDEPPIPAPKPESIIVSPEAAPEPKQLSTVRSEPIRNTVPQAPIHLQSSKKDVTNLDARAKIKTWSSNPSLLSEACTIDREIYGISSKPIPAAAVPSIKESHVEQRLTADEYNRLEVAHQAIIQIGDLLRQEKERCSPNPDDPGNFLFPRAFAYHVLKFSEALSPTSSNRKEVSEAFKSTVQTHILSMKLIMALRHAIRHEYQLVDLQKLKTLGKELASSTVKENIKAYRDQAAPKETKGKEPKEVPVSFQERTTISKKQDIANHATPDYFEEARNELMGMAKVTKKFIENGTLVEVLKENFYMDGLKMSVCNIEECVKRLGGSDDPELREIFYLGNRVAHEMGENPKLYVNEEISPDRMLRIINKAERILARIKLIAKK